MKQITCDNYITFGRYYSYKIRHVLEYDPSYILWMLTNHKDKFYIIDLNNELKNIHLKSVYDNVNSLTNEDSELLLKWLDDNKQSHTFMGINFKQGENDNVYFGREFEKIGITLKSYNEIYDDNLLEANRKNFQDI